MNGMTPTQTKMREALEGALFLLRGGTLASGNAQMYAQMGDANDRVIEEVSDLARRHNSAAKLVKESLDLFEADRKRSKKKKVNQKKPE